MRRKTHFLIGTRWFGVLGPCQLLIERLVEEGYDVFVFGQEDAHYARYDQGNARLIKINMARSYLSPIRDILDIIKLIAFVLWYKPDHIHSFNPKPALLSFMASLVRPRAKFFIGVTGLGNTFIRAKALEPFIRWTLRLACLRASFVFFQNPDDVDLFRQKRLIAEDKIRMFIGPGVDLRVFTPKRFGANRRVVVSCTARLIWQKGIREYIEAARAILKRYPDRDIRFKLFGEIDHEHPDCIDPAFLEQAVREGVVQYISWTDDIAAELRASDIFVLHSYREGAPRAILEASASCLPTIGSDAIGVRELIVDGVTGFLGPLKDIPALTGALGRLIEDPQMRADMGAAARRLIAEPLSLERATQAQFQMYIDASNHWKGQKEWAEKDA